MLQTKTIVNLAFLAILVSIAPARAEAAPPIRIAVVDLQKALSSSTAGKKAQKQYESEVKEAQSGLDAKKSELANLKKALDKQRSSLNEKALAEKEEEVASTERDLQRSFQDAKEKLQRKNAVLVGELVKSMREVVAELGKREGYSLVLDKNSPMVLYADDAVDITPAVIDAYNDKK